MTKLEIDSLEVVQLGTEEYKKQRGWEMTQLFKMKCLT